MAYLSYELGKAYHEERLREAEQERRLKQVKLKSMVQRGILVMPAILRQRNFALLWFGGLISMIGDWMLFVALPIYVYQLTGSTLATSATLVARILPRLLLGSVAGVFVDAWDRKKTMIASNALLALSLLPLFLARSVEWLWLIYLVSFLQSCIAQFFSPAENAFLPRVVGEEHLIAANSLNALNNNLARVIGPSLGGIVASLFSLPGIALIDAATFVVAGGMIALVTVSGQVEREALPGQAKVPGSWPAFWPEWRAGLRLAWREPVVMILFTIIIITSLGEGIFAVMFVVWVDKLLGGGVLEFGWFMAAQGIGGILGGFILGGLGHKLAPVRLLWLSAIVFGFLDLALFNYPRFFSGIWPGLALILIVGIPAVGFGASWNTLLQKAVADAYRGRLFGVYSMLSAFSFLVSTSLAGAVGNNLSPITMLNIQGSLYILAGLFTLATLSKVSRSSQIAQERMLEASI